MGAEISRRTNEPHHAYLVPGTTLSHEQYLARKRLLGAFPRRTLLHHHTAGTGRDGRCDGHKHELWRLGRLVPVQWPDRAPTAAELAAL